MVKARVGGEGLIVEDLALGVKHPKLEVVLVLRRVKAQQAAHFAKVVYVAHHLHLQV